MSAKDDIWNFSVLSVPSVSKEVKQLPMTDFQHGLAFIQPALRILVTLVMAWALLRLARTGGGVFRAFMYRNHPEGDEARRIDTLARVFQYTSNLVIATLALLLLMTELGMSISPILTATGVLGVAVGFGTQSLVKDFFNGMLLLVENQLRQGDLVEIAGRTGLVDELTLRHVRLKDLDGNVFYIPNSVITVVNNMSRDAAVIDVSLPPAQSLVRLLALVEQVGGEMRADPAFASRILSAPLVSGVEKWTELAVTLRVRIRVVPMEQIAVRQAFMLRLKKALESADAADAAKVP